jgi:NADPH-dependent 2,4-dienoyl-CoA reductase/sulfur reductase-like enzyme
MSEPIVILGGGLAAGTAAVELREAGHDGDVVLLAAENHVPYERPPLSKGYLLGEKPADATHVQPREWYDEHDIDLRTGTSALAVDLEAKSVATDNGSVRFGKLLIATGARARRLPLESTDALDVLYLRTMEESTTLHERLGEGHHLLVVGGGWIGMEVAATARQLGTTVTVVEPAEQPMLAALGAEVASRFAEVHRGHGVHLRTGTGVERLEGKDAVLTDGSTISPDTVLVGVGAVPNDELARDAGLEVDNGVVVDAGLRTSHPDVFAAGDVARAVHPLLGEKIRVEHWQNAISQGKAAAHALLGEDVSYEDLPYFFTDQYDLGMEFFGHATDGSVVRLEPGDSDTSFAAWWMRGDDPVAAMHVNQWDRSDELRDRVRQTWAT